MLEIQSLKKTRLGHSIDSKHIRYINLYLGLVTLLNISDTTLKLLVDWLLTQLGQTWEPYLFFMNREASKTWCILRVSLALKIVNIISECGLTVEIDCISIKTYNLSEGNSEWLFHLIRRVRLARMVVYYILIDIEAHQKKTH